MDTGQIEYLNEVGNLAEVLGPANMVVKAAPISLEEDIISRGLRTFPIERMERFKQREVQAIRNKAGWWGKHVGVAWTLYYLDAAGFIGGSYCLINDKKPFGVSPEILLVIVIGCILGGGFFSPGMKLGDAMAHWVKTKFAYFQESIPEKNQKDIDMVMQIPGVIVEIHHFQEDPLAVARKKTGSREEFVGFTYWDAPGFEKFR